MSFEQECRDFVENCWHPGVKMKFSYARVY
jgi:hypothetical protein